MIISKKIINDYRGMINDHSRNAWFKKHIYSTVKDKVFADIGSGTGILSAYAIEAGAKYGYAIENNKEAFLCGRHILDQLGYKNKITFINEQFQTAKFSNIEVIVADQIGPALFDQLQVEIWQQANKFCVPQYVSIPDELSVDLHVFNGTANINNALIDHGNLPVGFYSTLAKISINPDMVVKNIISVTPDTANQPLEFQIDLTGFNSATLVFVNKIGYQKDYLYFNQSTGQNWQFPPRLYINDCSKPIKICWNATKSNVENPKDDHYCGYWTVKEI